MSAVYADVALPGVRFVPEPFNLADLVRVVACVFLGRCSGR
jgi:hypothetical protein